MPLLEVLSTEARRLLPASLAASCLLAVPLGFACGALAGRLVTVRFARPAPETPWTERARVTLGVRMALRLLGPYATLLVGAVVYAFAFVLDDVARIALAVTAGLACYAGVDRARLRLERMVHGVDIGLRGWWSLKAIWFLLAAPQLVVVIAAALCMPSRFSVNALSITASTIALVVLIGTGALWRLLRAIGFIRPASEALDRAIDEAQRKTGITAAGAWILPTWGVPFCNAFALPVLRRIAFTSDALATLTHEEIVAIATHELGHVAETRTIAWIRTLRGTALVPLALARPLEASFGPSGILAAVFAMLAIALLFQRMARALEIRADRIAHGDPSHAHEDSATYARALEKVYQRNLVPAVMPGRRAHPDLYDRLIAAGARPSYPRPEKPRVRARVILAALASVAVAVGLAVIGTSFRKQARMQVIASMAREIDARLEARDDEGAWRLANESLLLATDDPRTWARYARATASLGQCFDALEDVANARTLPGATDADAMAALSQADLAIAACAARGGQ